MNNAWNLEGKTYEKGWSADQTSLAKKSKYFNRT